MDRERDRDAATSMIEEHDRKVGDGTPERERPGQDDPSSVPIDGQTPPESDDPVPSEDRVPKSPDPGPFAPQ